MAVRAGSFAAFTGEWLVNDVCRAGDVELEPKWMYDASSRDLDSQRAMGAADPGLLSPDHTAHWSIPAPLGPFDFPLRIRAQAIVSWSIHTRCLLLTASLRLPRKVFLTPSFAGLFRLCGDSRDDDGCLYFVAI